MLSWGESRKCVSTEHGSVRVRVRFVAMVRVGMRAEVNAGAQTL